MCIITVFPLILGESIQQITLAKKVVERGGGQRDRFLKYCM